jgi:hypothetical protein
VQAEAASAQQEEGKKKSSVHKASTKEKVSAWLL